MSLTRLKNSSQLNSGLNWRTLLLADAAAGGRCCWRTLLLADAAAGGRCCWRTLLHTHCEISSPSGLKRHSSFSFSLKRSPGQEEEEERAEWRRDISS